MMLAVLLHTSETRLMLVERSGSLPVYRDSLVRDKVSAPIIVGIIDERMKRKDLKLC